MGSPQTKSVLPKYQAEGPVIWVNYENHPKNSSIIGYLVGGFNPVEK